MCHATSPVIIKVHKVRRPPLTIVVSSDEWVYPQLLEQTTTIYIDWIWALK